MTREDLIALCEAAIIPEAWWWDRDSPGAQRQVGELWALLKAGCDFDLMPDDHPTAYKSILVQVDYRGFTTIESGKPKEREWFYLPTPQWLAARRAASEDWY